MRIAAVTARCILAAFVLSLASVSASAQTTPCGIPLGNGVVPGTKGLTSVDGGWIVNDSNLGVCWLALANLAGNPFFRALVGLSPLNSDGSTPLTDLTCSSQSFNFDDGFLGTDHTDKQFYVMVYFPAP